MKKLNLILGFFLIVSINVQGQHIPIKGLIGKYDFKQNINDSSLIKNNGTNNGAVYSYGRCGDSASAIKLDGTNDYINLNKYQDFNDHLTEFSLGFWLKANSSGRTNYEGILSCVNKASSGTVFGVHAFRDLNGNTNTKAISMTFRDENNKYWTMHVTDDSLFNGKWHHVMFVVDNSAKSDGRVYIDNVLKTQSTGHPTGDPDDFDSFDNDLLIGAENNRGKIQNYFEGELDDFVFYDRSLDSSEVDSVYKSDCKPLKIPIPQDPWVIGQFNFNNTTADSSIVKNDGVNNGGTFDISRCGDSLSAIVFDGTNDYVNFGKYAKLNEHLNRFSIGFWVKADGTGKSKYEGILSTVNSASAGTVFGIHAYRDLNGKTNTKAISITFRDENNKYWTMHTKHDSLFDDQWHNVVFVVDSSNQSKGNIYVDGKKSSLSTGHPTQDPASFDSFDNDLILGAENNRGTKQNYFEGKIDDMVIFSDALSAFQVDSIFKASCKIVLPPKLPFVIGEYDFTNSTSDSSTIANHGTNNGSTYIKDRCGNDSSALQFDGINDHVSLGDYEELSQSLTEFSVGFWIKADGKGKTQYEGIMSCVNNASAGTVFGIHAYNGLNAKNKENAIQMTFRDKDGKYWTMHTQSDTLFDDQWHSVMFVVNNSSQSLGDIYIDNKKKTLSSGHPEQDPSNYASFDNDVVLGAENARGTIQRYFEGSLDDVAIFSRALSSTQVDSIYKASCKIVIPPKPVTPRVIGRFDFNNSTADSSTIGNHGIRRGAVFVNDRCGDSLSAIDFDGTNDFVNLGNYKEVNQHLNQFSIGFWLKANGAGKTHYQGILSSVNNSTSGTAFSINAYRDLNGKTNHKAIEMSFRDEDSKYWTMHTQNDSLFDDRWHHVMFVVQASDSSDGEIFIDGKSSNLSIGHPVQNPDSFVSFDNDLILGAENNRGKRQHYFEGSLDDLAIFSQALSSSEVDSIYKASCNLIQPPPTSNLPMVIGQFDFTKNTNDSSTIANHGSNFGSTYVKDRCGNDSSALQFDGTNDYVSLGDYKELSQSLTEFSVGFWMKADGKGKTQYEGIMSCVNNASAGTVFGIHAYNGLNAKNKENSIQITFRDENGDYWTMHTQDDTLFDDSWHQVMFVINNSGKSKGSIYIDNKFKTLSSGHPEQNPDNFISFDNDVVLGAENARGTILRHFEGSLDDVAIFSQALTGTQVDSIFKASCKIVLPPKLPLVIGEYDFTNSTSDSSTIANHGVNKGSTFIKDRCGNDSSALSFDGTNDYVSLGDYEELSQSLTKFSVSFWMKADGKGKTQYEGIMSCVNNASAGTVFGIHAYNGLNAKNKENSIQMTFRDENGKYWTMHTQSDTLFDDQWHNVMFVVNNSSQSLGDLYIDNHKKTLSTGHPEQDPGNYASFDNDVVLGAENARGTIQRHFDGSLDDVAIFSQALTSTQVDSIYKASCKIVLPPKLPLVIGEYDFTNSTSDSSTIANHGVNKGSTFIKDRCGNDSSALSFDGTNDYVSLGDYEELSQSLTEFSVGFWMKADGKGKTQYEGIMSCVNNASAGTVFGIHAYNGLNAKNKENSIQITFRDENGDYWTMHTQDDTLFDDQWHNVMFVVNNSSQSLGDIYIDNKKKTLSSGHPEQDPGNYASFDNDVVLGAENARGTIQRHFDGSLDDVAIFSQALTSTQVDSIYKASCKIVLPPKLPLVIGDYKFSGNVSDSSSIQNNGAQHGGKFIIDRCGNDTFAIEFDGVNDFVNIGKYPELNKSLSSFSLGFWLKANSKGKSKYQGIMSAVNKSSSGTVFGVHAYRDVNGAFNEKAIQITFRDDNNKYWTMHVEDDSLFNDKWHQIVFVIENSSKSLGHIFIDNKKKPLSSGHPTEDPIDFSPFDVDVVVGSENVRGVKSNYFEGSLDDIVIFSAPLSSFQVDSLYKNSCKLLNSTPDVFNCRMSIYPNPILDNQRLFIQTSCSEVFDFDLINISGQLVANDRIRNGVGSLNLIALERGIYIVVLKNKNGEVITRQKVMY